MINRLPFNLRNIMVVCALSVFLFQSCKEPTGKRSATDESVKVEDTTFILAQNEIVVVTESDDPTNPIFVWKNSSFEEPDNNYSTNKENDSFKIIADNWNMISVSSKNSFVDELLIMKGDTLFLSLKEGDLTKRVQNGTVEKWSGDSIFTENKHKKDVDSLYNHLITVDYENPIEIQLAAYKIRTYMLFPNKSISEEMLPVVVDKYRDYLESLAEIRKAGDSKTKLLVDLLKEETFNNLHVLYYHFNYLGIKELMIADYFLHDRMDNKSSEKFYLSHLLSYDYFNRSSTEIKEIDYYKTYDSIPYLVTDTWVEKARMHYLEKMVKMPKKLEAFQRKFEEFNEQYGNTEFVNYIEDKYLIDLKGFYNSSFDVNFVNATGETNSLNELISSLKGKIIYIDYWASWCGPCRKAMPASKKLQDDFKNQEIEFVYFSVDLDKDKWIAASEADKIMSNEHNYLVLNHHTSTIKEKLKIDRIPRYLIYDKEGKLINHNAPGPEGQEIREVFSSLL